MVVLLPSSYDETNHNNNNKHKTSFTTTTTLLTSNNSKNQVRLDTVISKIIQIVLRARLGSDYYCIQPHTTNHCYLTISPTTLPFDNIQQNGINLLICILYKNTLLEQWKITFDPSFSSSSPSPIVIHDATAATITTPTTTTTALIENNNNNNNISTKHSENTDIKLLLQAVYSQTRLLPIHNWLSQNKLNKSDLSFLITPTITTNTTEKNKTTFLSSSSSSYCYSHMGSKELIQQQQNNLAFPSSSSSIGIHDFITATTTDIQGQLKLQVLYDKQLDKKLSFLSRPSLSSTSTLIIKNDTNNHLNTCDKNSKPTPTPIFMSKKNNIHSSLFSHPYNLNETKSNNHHVSTTTTPVITMRRLSKLSLSALNDDNDEDLDSNNNNSNLFNSSYSTRSDPHYDNQFHPSTTTLHPHHPLSIPISSSPIQYTHHGHSLAYSTSPSTSILSQQQQQPLIRRSSIQYHHGLAGSYEESLLSGRMSTLQPSKPITFLAQIGVLGYGHCKPSLKCPQHRSIYFPAFFYDNHNNTNDNYNEDMSIFNSQQPQQPTATIPPYVGTIDLTMDEEKKTPSPGYRIPSKGQLQIAIKNPNKHLVKLFLIPYDVSSMPRNTKTFLRQTSYLTTNTTTTSSSSSSSVLKYAIHIQLCRTDKNRVYLYKQIRVVFTNRCMDAREQYRVVCEGPKEPVYVPL